MNAGEGAEGKEGHTSVWVTQNGYMDDLDNMVSPGGQVR